MSVDHTQFAAMDRLASFGADKALYVSRPSEQVLEVCLCLNIQCVSIYVFSIENFSRPPDEVNALMEMARGRFHDLAQQG
jgi:undecaprenyl diphosphate synthase